MNSDPVIDEVRSVRRKISASYGHDVRKMITDHMKQQQRYADRLVMPGQSQSRGKSSLHAVDALHDRAHAEIAAGEFTTLTSYRAARKRKQKRAK
jgi:hypothetical protein